MQKRHVLGSLICAMTFVMILSGSIAHAHEKKQPAGKSILGYDQVDDVNLLKAVGSPFTQALKLEYNKMSNVLHNKGQVSLAKIFAVKGIEAAKGNIVPPENVIKWSKEFMDINSFAIEHARLSKLLSAGARQLSPVNTAIAQGSFDCWLILDSMFPEPKEKPKDYVSPFPDFTQCKDRYQQTIVEIEKQLKIPRDTQVKTELNDSPQPTVMHEQTQNSQQRLYNIFFDSNSTSLDDVDQAMLIQISEQFKKGAFKELRITGYTDTKGSKAYNEKLSLNRAKNVRDFMTRHDIPATKIVIEAKGQSQLAIPTKDGVDESKNRRVELLLL